MVPVEKTGKTETESDYSLGRELPSDTQNNGGDRLLFCLGQLAPSPIRDCGHLLTLSAMVTT